MPTLGPEAPQEAAASRAATQKDQAVSDAFASIAEAQAKCDRLRIERNQLRAEVERLKSRVNELEAEVAEERRDCNDWELRCMRLEAKLREAREYIALSDPYEDPGAEQFAAEIDAVLAEESKPAPQSNCMHWGEPINRADCAMCDNGEPDPD